MTVGNRSRMIARGLRGVRRMALGDNATVYVLVKATGDALESAGSTTAAHETRLEDGRIELRILEDDTLTRVVLDRAAAFAIASGGEIDPTYYVWHVDAKAGPPVGQASRGWLYVLAPTGNVFTPEATNIRYLEDGTTPRLLEDGTTRLLEAA